MQALQMIAGQGGWPEHLSHQMIWCRFMAPTFQSRYGRPGFTMVQALHPLRRKTGFAIA